MTGENRKENIADELARASEALREARALVDAGLPNGAVSRAYYAVFHVMRAALLSRDVESKTHAGTMRLFNLELTRKGVIAPFNKLLRGLQSSREAADYDAAVSFSTEEANALLSDAESFSAAVVELLVREGWAERA